jgi:hypothetical protein
VEAEGGQKEDRRFYGHSQMFRHFSEIIIDAGQLRSSNIDRYTASSSELII